MFEPRCALKTVCIGWSFFIEGSFSENMKHILRQ